MKLEKGKQRLQISERLFPEKKKVLFEMEVNARLIAAPSLLVLLLTRLLGAEFSSYA